MLADCPVVLAVVYPSRPDLQVLGCCNFMFNRNQSYKSSSLSSVIDGRRKVFILTWAPPAFLERGGGGGGGGGPRMKARGAGGQVRPGEGAGGVPPSRPARGYGGAL